MFFSEHTHTHHFTPTLTHTGRQTPEETTHTTEDDSNHIPDYGIEMRTPTFEGNEIDRIPNRGHQDYNGYDITTKWYQPKTTDNRVVPPESEFFATIVGKLQCK